METLVVGVAGGTGSGKTTVARGLMDSLPSGKAQILQHDSYYRHRPELTFLERSDLNFDHPDSLDTPLMVEHLKALKAGQDVEVPRYDFTKHLRRTETRHVAAALLRGSSSWLMRTCAPSLTSRSSSTPTPIFASFVASGAILKSEADPSLPSGSATTRPFDRCTLNTWSPRNAGPISSYRKAAKTPLRSTSWPQSSTASSRSEPVGAYSGSVTP